MAATVWNTGILWLVLGSKIWQIARKNKSNSPMLRMHVAKAIKISVKSKFDQCKVKWVNDTNILYYELYHCNIKHQTNYYQHFITSMSKHLWYKQWCRQSPANLYIQIKSVAVWSNACMLYTAQKLQNMQQKKWEHTSVLKLTTDTYKLS